MVAWYGLLYFLIKSSILMDYKQITQYLLQFFRGINEFYVH